MDADATRAMLLRRPRVYNFQKSLDPRPAPLRLGETLGEITWVTVIDLTAIVSGKGSALGGGFGLNVLQKCLFFEIRRDSTRDDLVRQHMEFTRPFLPAGDHRVAACAVISAGVSRF